MKQVLGVFLISACCGSLGADEPAELASRAQRAMAAAHWEEASGLYARLLGEMPSVTAVRFNYALALHSAGQYSNAIKQLEQVTREVPSMTNAWLILGLAHQKLGEPEKALPAFDRVLKTEPRNTVALLEIGDACLTTGRLKQAAGYFHLLMQVEPASPKASQGLAVVYASLASETSAQLLQRAPDSPFSYALLAQSRFDAAQYQSAFGLYRAALAANAPIPDLHESIAAVYRATAHSDWATAELAKQTKTSPLNCSWKELACAWLGGRFEEVISSAGTDETPEALYWKARAYGELAKGALKRLATLPESPELHEVTGDVYRIQGRKEDSVQEWRAAVRLAPTDGYAANGLARALWLHRDYEEAQALIERLLKSNPESPELNHELGSILLEHKNIGRCRC